MEKLEDILDSYLSQTESCLHKNIYTAALIEVGKKRYPKFGNVLILAGGSGSGKGFQLSKLIGLEGKVMDIDKFESLMINSEYWNNKILKQCGICLKELDLDDPNDLNKLKEISRKNHLQTRLEKTLKYIKTIENKKPNLIFDVTLQSDSKFRDICNNVRKLGYDKRNIHLVWVVNDIDVSIKQNRSRGRRVDEDIVRNIHRDVSISLYSILRAFPSDVQKYLDGDIWISFNQIDVDIKAVGKKDEGFYIDEVNAFKVKSVGNQIEFPEKFEKEIINKIAEYSQNPMWLKS